MKEIVLKDVIPEKSGISKTAEEIPLQGLEDSHAWAHLSTVENINGILYFIAALITRFPLRA